MGRPRQCSCKCVPCNPLPVTLKAFDAASGTVLWESWLEDPMLSTDGYIYGYTYEEDDSAAALASAIIRLTGPGSGSNISIPATSTKRYKKWIRKIDQDGTVIGDATFWHYTCNRGYTEQVFEYATAGSGIAPSAWMQDMCMVTAAGEIAAQSGNYITGWTNAEAVLVWDSNNVTTTRVYTLIATGVRDSFPIPFPLGGVNLRFIAADDGTNAEQTIDIDGAVGMTAAAMATALEAFPHIVSATGTGGPYPLNSITLTIEWAQDTTHFRTITRLLNGSRGYRTWLRDWDTGNIVATCNASTSVSTADRWQIDNSDNLIGISTNPYSGLGTPIQAGCAVERFTRSGSNYNTQAWRTRPTLDYGALGDSGTVGYYQPSINGTTLVVGHDQARGNGQPVGSHSEWHQLNLTTGAIIGVGGKNDQRIYRPTFANATDVVAAGWDASTVQCEFGAPNYIALMDGITTYTEQWTGPYGLFVRNGVSANDDAMFSGGGLQPMGKTASGGGNYNGDVLVKVWATDPTILTVLTRAGGGWTSRVAPDGYFSLQNYYRIEYSTFSPINYRWISSGMEWRFAFFANANVTSTSSPTIYTDWLPFTADETDALTALTDLLGSNDGGSNAFINGPIYPQTAAEPMPQMIWQRYLHIVLPSERPNFPATVPPIPWNLNNRTTMSAMYIQVKAATANEFVEYDPRICRVEWSTGAITWQQPFGISVVGGTMQYGGGGVLLGDKFIVGGNRVKSTCFSVYQWQTVGMTDQWVLIQDGCPTGYIAEEPAAPGTTIGEYQQGLCVLP